MTLTAPRLRILRILEVISGIAMVVTVLAVWDLTRNGPVAVERWQVGVGALPWVVFVASSFALMHHAWFGREQKPVALWAYRLFFWGAVACMAVVFVGLYAAFVFPLRG